MGWNYPLTLDSKEPFCAGVVSPLSDRIFSLLCPCHDCSLQVRDKDWLFTLYFLAIDSSTGAHLSLISGNAERRVTDCRFPIWSPSVSYVKITFY